MNIMNGVPSTILNAPILPISLFAHNKLVLLHKMRQWYPYSSRYQCPRWYLHNLPLIRFVYYRCIAMFANDMPAFEY
jgi:hypothetical protein